MRLACALLFALLSSTAVGQSFPSRQITIVVPYESAGLMGAAQILKGVLGDGAASS